MLSKLRHVSNIKTLRSFLFVLQNTNSVERVHLLQTKALRIMFLQSRNFHKGPIFKDFKIKAVLENCIFISNF